MPGRVEGLFVTAQKGGACAPVERVRLVAGRGVEGDRYFLGAKGSGPKLPPGAREVTLVEAEALEALTPPLAFAESRRNVVVRGADLNALVGVTFMLGDARLRGIMPCDPCVRLDRLAGRKLVRALAGKGGLRAEVLASGDVHLGSALTPDGDYQRWR